MTERTFFRHFSDKREVLFSGAGALQDLLVTAVADALRSRGVGDPAPGLTGEVAIAVFKVAFERWVDKDNRRDLVHLLHESLDELKAATAGACQPAPLHQAPVTKAEVSMPMHQDRAQRVRRISEPGPVSMSATA